MVSLVVEAPLADGQSRSGLFDLSDHLVKLFSLVLTQQPVVFHAGDVQLVLGLGFWGFEWTGQDGDFHIAKFLKNEATKIMLVAA